MTFGASPAFIDVVDTWGTGFVQIAMTLWFIHNHSRKHVVESRLYLVPRTVESGREIKQLPPRSSCRFLSSLLAVYFTCILINMAPFYKLLGFVFFQTLKKHSFHSQHCEGSPSWCGRARRHYFGTPLLHCTSMQNVTLCHRGSCG